MPYRVSGVCVEKQTDAGWETVKCHETAAQAQRHLAALNINVMVDEKAYEGIDFKPTEAMATEAKRGLEWRREFNRGGTAVGVARARDIANRTNLSPDTVKRMVSYFARHEVDKQGQGWSPDENGYPSAGRVAWALWGGDSGKSWANAIARRMTAQDEKGKAMVETKEKGMALYTQEEVGYTDYAVRRNPVNAVCQTCRWFSKAVLTEDGTVEHFCHLVEPYPLDIVATGYCEQWTERPVVKPEADDTQETEAVEVEVETDAMDEDEDGLPLPLRAALSETMADDMMGKAIGRFAAPAVLQKQREAEAQFTVKALGDGLWMAAFSNNFKDRQGEIISEAAFDRYLSRAQRGVVPMPELWVWHTAGTRAGKALWVDKAGHVIYAVGKFDDTPQGRALEATMQRAKAGEFTLSHGFTYEPWALKEGVYHDLNVFEISVLPVGAEANPYTAITAIREDSKMLTDDKKQFFARVFGERAGEVIKLAENFEQAGKAIEDAGVQYKEYADYTAPVETGAKAADDVEAGYKDLVLDVVQSQGAVLTETHAMQKALNKALNELAELKAMIAEGVTKAGQGTPLPDNEVTAAAGKAVSLKQAPEVSGFESLFPGMFSK